ncbi:hypothetical protein AVEN_75806-1 [Araneus ventricosus]|uniref:Uncharacterized protein n=1 Tax=Araneus ventricosus TaxID=182803 RepID=A0A4Y2I6I9_ARAVE|nr:hypothetical protein AVEN_75806-1 [Araneus ventricosus]
MALISIVYRLSNRRVVSSRVLVLRNQTHVVHTASSSSLLFSAASFSDVTRDGSAIYRYSAAAGGPHIINLFNTLACNNVSIQSIQLPDFLN